MAVDDLWHLKEPGTCPHPRCGAKYLPSQRHGRGKRYRVRWKDPKTGKQVTQLFDNNKRRAAEEHDAKMHADISRGTYRNPKAGRVTVAEYARDWLAEQGSDASTREAVEIRFRVHILPALGHRTLRDLEEDPSIVRAWVNGLRNTRDGRPLAASSARAVFANLSSMLSAAVDDNKMSSNPCRARSVKPPALERRKVVPWSAERVEAVRSGLPEQYAAMVDCGAGIGLRQGEVLGLAVDDVDWLRRMVHVRRQVKRVGNRPVFALPKEGKERHVPLPDAVALRLAAHLQACPARPVTLPWDVPDGRPVTASLIFTDHRTGKEINRHHFNAQLWKPALVSAGVIPTPTHGRAYIESREHGFHALRHRYASVLIDAGVDVLRLADYLGHEDPGFTLKTYGHLIPSSEDTARRAIDRAYAADDAAAQNVILSKVVPNLYPRPVRGA